LILIRGVGGSVSGVYPEDISGVIRVDIMFENFE
jgi:hypothetical protein